MRWILPLALLTTACMPGPAPVDSALEAKEREIQIEYAQRQYRENLDRIHNVLPRLLTANADLCPSTNRLLGFTVAIVPNYDTPEFRVMHRIHGTTTAPTITSVMAPAEAAGLRRGDILIRLNGQEVVPTVAGVQNLQPYIDAIADGSDPVRFVIWRDGERKSITENPPRACRQPVRVLLDGSVNAYANAGTVYVTNGMMNFLKSDDELAFVLGHEMGHIIKGHSPSLFGQQQIEAEADYVGAYLAARAGFDIEQAAPMWRRMAALHPLSIHGNAASSHPSTVYRFVALEAAAREISEKKAKGLPLIPDQARALSAR